MSKDSEFYFSEEEKNIGLVKSLVQKFMDGNAEGYIEGCHENFYGKIFSGLIPGGDNIKGKEELVKMFELLPEYMEIVKFEPVNWAAVGNTVYFTVNWEFIWKHTGKRVVTSANVRKVVKDGKIIEKYHIVNYGDI